MIGKILQSPTGRAALIGLAVIIAGYVARILYTQSTEDPNIARVAQVQSALQNSVDALSTHLETKETLPAPAGWTPAEMPCGEAIAVDKKEAEHPTWAALGIDLTKPTRYQYRFRVDGDDFVLLARTDTDCDGLYQVHKLAGDKGWTGVGADKIRVDNPEE